MDYAACALETCGTLESGAAVEELLAHPEPAVRSAAARALGRLGVASYRETLKRVASDDAEVFVRRVAARSLALGETAPNEEQSSSHTTTT